MNKILKCATCKFHIKKSVSTNYILSFCLKYLLALLGIMKIYVVLNLKNLLK